MFVCTDLQGVRHCLWDTFPPQAGRKNSSLPRGEGALHAVWVARVFTGIRLSLIYMQTKLLSVGETFGVMSEKWLAVAVM